MSAINLWKGIEKTVEGKAENKNSKNLINFKDENKMNYQENYNQIKYL